MAMAMPYAWRPTPPRPPPRLARRVALAATASRVALHFFSDKNFKPLRDQFASRPYRKNKNE